MNADVVLDWLIRDAAAAKPGDFARFRTIDPQELIDTVHFGIDDAPRMLQNLDKDTPNSAFGRVARSKGLGARLTDASAALARLHPEHFLLWRAPYYDRELFDGLAFLSTAEPRLSFSFDRFGSGQVALKRWRKVGDTLLELAGEWWPRETSRRRLLPGGPDPFARQLKLWHFLYEGLIPLHVRRGEGERAWLVGGKDGDYTDWEPDDLHWSGRMEMAAGETVYMYRMGKATAITDVYSVAERPRINPLAPWRACTVKLQRVARIEPLRFADMKADPILGQWGLIKRNLRGLVAEALPPRSRRRLERLIREGAPLPERKAATSSGPGSVEEQLVAGDFVDEDDFCTNFIAPLLAKHRLRTRRERACDFHVGSQCYHCRIDFLVRDQEKRLLTIIEAKRTLTKLEDVKRAARQGRSYALQVGSPSFVVMAPEGCWVYDSLRADPNRSEAMLRVAGDAIAGRFGEVVEVIEQLRDQRRAQGSSS